MAIAGGTLVLMMLHVVTDAVAKNVFSHPLEGTLAIVSAYYMVPVVFLPLCFVELHEENFRVELFTRRLGPRSLTALSGVLRMAATAILLLTAWFSAQEAILQSTAGEMWETALGAIAVWPGRWVVPVGCSAMGLCTLTVALRDFGALIAPARRREGERVDG